MIDQMYQDLVGAWGDKTFGQSTPDSVFAHLADEIEELGEALAARDGDTDPWIVALEIADCVILLMQLSHKLHIGLPAAIHAKMMRNIARNWGEPDERGVVRHIEREVQS